MKLNIGGGYLKLDGFTNIDLCPGADITHDLKEPLPFPDKSVEEIMGIHVIESFYQWELPAILKDWERVLNGKLTIEFTELSSTIDMYLNGDEEEKLRGHWGLYGDQSKPVDPIIVHHYVYEKDELEKLLLEAGFKDILFSKDNISHNTRRDLRVTCFTS
jgi:predicted SAM-dependent methyltransferase